MKIFETTTRRYRDASRVTDEALLHNIVWTACIQPNNRDALEAAYPVYRERRLALDAEAARRGLTEAAAQRVADALHQMAEVAAAR